MSIKELYYRFKYRPKKGQCGATGIIMSKKKGNDDFKERLENLKSTIIPAYNCNADVLEYVRSKHNLVSVEFSDRELTEFKVNYILNVCPSILTTQIAELPQEKSPSRKQFLEYQEMTHKRFEEARLYPFEKLNIDIDVYAFEYSFENSKSAHFQIVCESKTDEIFITAKSNDIPLDDTESKTIQKVIADIRVYKGISQKDFNEENGKYLAYLVAVMELEKD